MDDTIASTELARVNRTLKTVSAGNRTLLRATGEMELLEAMCRVVVEIGGYRMAFVGYAMDDPRKSVVHVAAVGADDEFLRVLPDTWEDNEFGQTAIATAIRTGKPSVARNILTEAAFASLPRLREQVQAKGCAAVTALPLQVENKIIGAMTVLAKEPEAFSAAEVELLSELGSDLSYGIANLRTRERHRKAEETIHRLAFYDALTGLPNRTELIRTLDRTLLAARVDKMPVAVLHVELRRFAEINRALGFKCGDQLLLEVVHRIEQVLSFNGLLARHGEAEFSVVLNGPVEHAQILAQRIIESMEAPIAISQGMIDARVGVGCAFFPDHGDDADSLVRRAAAALHQCNSSFSGYMTYVGGAEQDSRRRLRLIGDLHRAVCQNELQLFCQPKVELTTGTVCGLEALVRWHHPQQGMISPYQFIPFAEEAGAMQPVTRWILEASFRQSSIWHQSGLDLPIAVNLSVHDLYNPHLVDYIKGLLKTWSLPSELIQFELTESALMADPALARETMLRLKEIGAELYIDDFGTGYSGLSYLQRLPVDGIKIDQSFVKPMDDCKDSAVIVSSTIALGHNLGLKVIAEGVESKAICKRLAALGCDVAQGYLFSKPMPAITVHAWVRDHHFAHE